MSTTNRPALDGRRTHQLITAVPKAKGIDLSADASLDPAVACRAIASAVIVASNHELEVSRSVGCIQLLDRNASARLDTFDDIRKLFECRLAAEASLLLPHDYSSYADEDLDHLWHKFLSDHEEHALSVWDRVDADWMARTLLDAHFDCDPFWDPDYGWDDARRIAAETAVAYEFGALWHSAASMVLSYHHIINAGAAFLANDTPSVAATDALLAALFDDIHDTDEL